MSSEPETGEWQSLVAAEQAVSKLRTAIYGLPRRAEVLADAISGSSVWDRTVALRFIREFPEDTPHLLDQLVELAMSTGWARESIEAIRAARSEIDSTRMTAIVKSFLTDADAEDYLRLAELTAQTEAWQALGAVIAAAAASDDPEKQEVARDFTESHGTRIQMRDAEQQSACSHSDWLSAFDRAYRHVDDLDQIPCPHCGRYSLRLVFVVDDLDSVNATGAFWCDSCLWGLMPERASVPGGAVRMVRGTEKIPNYRLVLDTDSEQ